MYNVLQVYRISCYPISITYLYPTASASYICIQQHLHHISVSNSICIMFLYPTASVSYIRIQQHLHHISVFNSICIILLYMKEKYSMQTLVNIIFVESVLLIIYYLQIQKIYDWYYTNQILWIETVSEWWGIFKGTSV